MVPIALQGGKKWQLKGHLTDIDLNVSFTGQA